MAEFLRDIINNINKLFGKDYNMISFDSLNATALLQVLVDVLSIFEATAPFDVSSNTQESVIKIIESLQNIKYTPENNTSPAEFRDGIAQGKRTIIHNILHWIFLNSKEVKTRAYLAKYLVKVEIPLEMMGEQEVQMLYIQYENLLKEFKTAHTENVKAVKLQEETVEIRKDIERMENDSKKLDQRIEKQSEKVSYIQNKEPLLVTVRSYRYEHMQQKKLTAQLKDQKDNLSKMESKLKQLKIEIMQKKNYHSRPGGPIEKLNEELQVNNMIIEERLKKELISVESNLELLETVINDAEPINSELQQLEEQHDEIVKSVQELAEKRVLLMNPKEDKLAPFRQQATIIANQKQTSADKLMNIQALLKQIEDEIQEKQMELERQVGGKILHGDELKNYVNKLRGLSVVHKDSRATYQALAAEIGVLTRTLEILKSLDGELAAYLEKKDKIASTEGKDDEVPSSFEELQEICRDLVKHIDGKRAENAQFREELTEAKQELHSLSATHGKSKATYDDATAEIVKIIDNIKEDIDEKSRIIEDGEAKWKNLQREIKRKENILHSINEEIASTAAANGAEVNRKDVLRRKVEEEESLKLKLSTEIGELEIKQNGNEAEVKMLRGLMELLKQKLK